MAQRKVLEHKPLARLKSRGQGAQKD
jgi:hypothetical protein